VADVGDPGGPESADRLRLAFEQGDEATARAVVAAHSELATRPFDDASVVRLAAYRGMRALVADLLDADIDLDVCDAAALDRVDVLQDLLDRDPDQRDAMSGDGFTPLHLAAFFGQVKAAELLLNRSANADAVSANALAVRPINSAAAGSHEVVVHLLLDHGADADAAMAGGFRPLHAAAHGGLPSMVRLLLERGADPNARTDDGQTPADLAADNDTRAMLTNP